GAGRAPVRRAPLPARPRPSAATRCSMRFTRWIAAAALLILAACAEQPTAPRLETAEPAPVFSAVQGGIPGDYIVVLEERGNPRAVAAVAGVSPRHVYEHALTGFA